MIQLIPQNRKFKVIISPKQYLPIKHLFCRLITADVRASYPEGFVEILVFLFVSFCQVLGRRYDVDEVVLQGQVCGQDCDDCGFALAGSDLGYSAFQALSFVY